VATCPTDCTVCPDDGDLAIPIDDGGVKKVVCAHDYPAWGVVAVPLGDFLNSEYDTITDKVTGLEWQVTVSSDFFSWLGARNYCDSLDLANQSDWRLPTQFELESLVNFNVTSPPAMAYPFNALMSNNVFWSATPYTGGLTDAWVLNVDAGASSYQDINGGRRARCVREYNQAQVSESMTSSNGRYEVDKNEQTVFDKITSLTWQRDPSTVGGDGTGRFEWAAAKAWCGDLELGNYTDWRMPEIFELRTLINRKYGGSAIDTTGFPNLPLSGSKIYLSATTMEVGPTTAWGINFYDGFTSSYSLTGNHRVRCVR
jgi:hypothetical protein